MADASRLIELRVLEGPNLYFTRPAIKLTLAVPGWLTVSDERILAIAGRLGVPSGAKTGPPESEQRRRHASIVFHHPSDGFLHGAAIDQVRREILAPEGLEGLCGGEPCDAVARVSSW